MAHFAQAYNSDIYTFNIRGSSIYISDDFIPGDFSTADQLKTFYDGYVKKSSSLSGSLPQLTTTNVARDLKFLIDLMQPPKPAAPQKVFINGHSYGTYVCNRFAQLYPDVATGIISDGTCFGAGMKLLDWDIYGQRWFKDVVLEKCKADSFCASYLGSDPATYVKDALASIEDGQCKDIVKTMGGLNVIKYFFSNVINMANGEAEIALPLMILYRLKNCAFYDRLFLDYAGLKSFYSTVYDSSITLFSNMKRLQLYTKTLNFFTGYHMKVGELSRYPIPTLDALNKEVSQYPVGPYEAQFYLYKAKNGSQSFWPWTPANPVLDDGYGNQGNVTKWLFVSGDLDRNTPIFFANEAVKHFPTAKHFVVKNGPHVSGFRTPCGFAATSTFISSRGAISDGFAACEMPLSFKGSDYAISNFHMSYAQDYWSPMVFLPTLYFGLAIAGICVFLIIIVASISICILKCRKKKDADLADFASEYDREPLIEVQ